MIFACAEFAKKESFPAEVVLVKVKVPDYVGGEMTEKVTFSSRESGW